jgi:hypothetical protein
MRRETLGLAWGVCALGLLLTGCPSPNVYGTPRTIPKGKFGHTVAAEIVGYHVDLRDDYIEGEPEDYEVLDEADFRSPTMPSYILRPGLGERFDMGFRVSAMSSLGLDFKWNIVRSPVFDVAIDPMVQWAFLLDITHFHFPVLLGFNASESLSVVLTPGIIYGYSDLDEDIDADLSRVFATNGMSLRAGLGFNIRVSPKFALQPEITVIRGLEEPKDSNFDSIYMYVAGLGFNFGTLPDFSDVDGDDPAPAQ